MLSAGDKCKKGKRKGFTLFSAWTAGGESRLRRDSRSTGRREHVKQTALQDKQKSVFNFARSDPSHVGAKHGRGLVGRGGWVLVPLGQSQSRINLSAGEWEIVSKCGAPLLEWPHWWSDMFAFTHHMPVYVPEHNLSLIIDWWSWMEKKKPAVVLFIHL